MPFMPPSRHPRLPLRRLLRPPPRRQEEETYLGSPTYHPPNTALGNLDAVVRPTGCMSTTMVWNGVQHEVWTGKVNVYR